MSRSRRSETGATFSESDAKAVADDAQPTPRRRFTAKESQIIEALCTIGMPDKFTPIYLRRAAGTISLKRWQDHICSRDHRDIHLGRAKPLRPKFRMSPQGRNHLQTLEGPDSWLWQCLDAFPQFVTRSVAAHAAGIANDSKYPQPWHR
jgi:hypothetical protein